MHGAHDGARQARHGSMPVRGGAMAKLAQRARSGSTASGCRCTSRRSRARWSRRWPRASAAARTGRSLRLLLHPRLTDRAARPHRRPRPHARPAAPQHRQPDGARARRQVQRDPGRGERRARRPTAAGLPAPRTCSLSCARCSAHDVELEVVQLRPGPARARHVAASRRWPRSWSSADPGSTATPLLMPGVSDGALLRAARHPDLRLRADEAAARTSTSGPACTAPTSASPRTQSSSARTRSHEALRRFGRRR